LNNVYVMSFKPLYAKQVLTREKTCEIRTCFQKLKPGDIVIVYASNPVKAFLGYLLVGFSRRCTYSEVLELIEEYKCKIPRNNWVFVVKHYHGRENLLFFTIGDTKIFRKKIRYETIRGLKPGFKIPYSYIRVEHEFFDTLLELVENT